MTHDLPVVTKPADWFETVMRARIEANPSCTAGFSGQFCCRVEGESGGEWTCTIDGIEVTVMNGLVSQPVFTLAARSDHFVQFLNGQLNARSAFATGRLRIAGAMGEAMKLFRLFVP